jgi:hypothetical protein
LSANLASARGLISASGFGIAAKVRRLRSDLRLEGEIDHLEPNK